MQQIMEVAGQRWKVEEAIKRAKGDCGLDQYEVRSWTGWYRHITLSLVGQFCATLMMEQANTEQGKKPGSPSPSRAVCSTSSPERIGRFLIPYTLPEVLHLIWSLVWQQAERLAHVVAWSFFRRHHQAVAQLCHYKRHLALDTS